MELDTNKIDDAVLALLYLGLHDGARAWKGFDWEAMNRLHEQGYITDPRGKAKSVIFTEEGSERAKRLLEEHFSKDAEPNAAAAGAAVLVPRAAESLQAAPVSFSRLVRPRSEVMWEVRGWSISSGRT